MEDQEKKEETEIKDSNEKNETLDNAENKSESEKVEKEALEKVEEVEDKELSKVEENKESGEKERAGEVAIDETNFPDEVFRQYVSDKFDTNNDRVLSEDEINAVTRIDVWNKYKISDLTGIEYFENLKYLDCDSTGITSLDVSKNTALEYLDCRNTKITSLDVSNNTALEKLYCSDTGITSLDVSNNAALLILDCSDTGITSLDVSQNTALLKLDCSSTRITSLDVSNNTALEYLNCNGTPITSLDVSNNTALEYLDCRYTGITSLDVSQNTALEYLNCNGTPITSLDVSNNTALEYLYCSDTGIISLDVSQNTALVELNCMSTQLTSLDVSNNTALEYLNCNGTPITSLDVSNNTALLGLYCIDTGITNLDVSNNAALEYLICNDTGITNLDVSKNTALLVLACQGAPLTGLNLGNNNNLDLYIDSLNKEVTLTVTSQSFNTIDKLGCKGSEISELKGAQLDKDNNIMTIESMANKITYKYNCGTAKGNPVYLNVTLNLEKGSSTIEVNELDRAYTGNPVNLIKDQDYTITGSEGDVTLTYYKRNSNGVFDEINEATEVGDYKVKIDLNGTDYCKGTQVEKEFKIEKATNTWKDELSIKGWTYGETPKKPTASAQFGDVEFSYSSSENGKFSSTVPTTAGTWYVKAEVLGNDNYTGISDVKEFTIAKAVAPEVVLPTNLSAVQDSLLSTIELPKGWTWIKSDEKVTVNNKGYKARLTVDDNNYDYSKVEGYNKDGHYVERTLKVSVSQGKNAWKVMPSIKGWTYGEKVNAPLGSANHGDIIFTYSNSEDGNFEATVPKNAGTWYMKATVSETPEYAELSKVVEFEIKKATNTWTKALSIEGWTYGETPKKPTASAQFGEIKFSYSNKKTRNYTEEVPTEAGKWYVKAEVGGNDNYTGISDVKEFTIAKAVAPEVVLPTNLSAVQDSLLSTIELPKGWTWIKSDEKVTVNNKGYKARLTVDDNNYDYSNVEGYNKDGHYVERTIKVSVSQGENSWKVVPSIKGWTYGEKANAPVGTANHGEVIFTYSNSETGKFESAVPKNAGTWYMKATVLATDEYTGLNEIVEFKIEKATPKFEVPTNLTASYGQTLKDVKLPEGFTWVNATQSVGNIGENKFIATYTPKDTANYNVVENIEITVTVSKLSTPEVIEPSNLSAVQNDLLSTVELPEGWTWVNPNEKVTVNNNGYKARLKVDDEKYDYTNVEGYNKDGHYVERTLKVSVSENRNEWNVIPSIKGWTYGEKANTPIGTANHGEVIFTYSNSPTGKFESTVPKNAGIWYMKATVLATDEYTGLDKIVEFKIEKATPKFEVPKNLTASFGQTLKDVKLPEGFTWNDATQSVGNIGVNKFIATYTPKDTNNYKVVENIEITVTVSKLATPEVIEPSNLSAVQNDLLSTVELPEGWTWVNPNEKVTVNNNGYKARLKVDDEKYDYTNVEGYNKDGHYVERTLKVSVSENRNEWNVIPSIKGWTYGEGENAPVGTANHGEVTFTYSNSPTGKFESAVPKNAGTWYMKATVLATHEYTGLNEIVEFTISPKNGEDINLPEINEDVNLDDLVITVGDKTLVKGTDYDLAEKQEGNTVTVIITFKGNYTGTITKTYEVEDSGNNKPPVNDDNNNDNDNNGDDNNNDNNDDNNNGDNNDNNDSNNGDNSNDNNNDDSNNNNGNGGSNNNNSNNGNGNNNSSNGNKDEVIVKPTLPQTGEKSNLGLWGLVLTITGGAIAFITGKSRKTIKKEK